MPQLAEVHINRALTDISIAYMNSDYIGETVAPILPVTNRSDKYFIYDQEAFLRGGALDANGNSKSIRRPGTETNISDYDLTTDTYYCDMYAEGRFIPYETIREADVPLAIQADETMSLMEKMKLINEQQVASMVGTIAKYPTSNQVTLTTGNTGTSWAQYGSANSLPFENILVARDQVYKGIIRQANTLLLSYESARYLADHPEYKDYVKYTDPNALGTADIVKNIRGLNVIVGMAQALTSPEGSTTPVTGDVWVGSDGNPMAAVMYINPVVGEKTVGSFRTFQAPDPESGVSGYVTKSFDRDTHRALQIEVSTVRDYKSIAVNAAGLNIGSYLINSTTA